jgi:FAD:protein FMN transferase
LASDPNVSEADDELVMFGRVTVALGTFVSIEAGAPRRAGVSAQAALDAAYTAFETVDSAMHPTRAGSDLVALASATAGELISVHPWTFEVLSLAQRMCVVSGGAFDPCVPEKAGRLGDLELVPPAGVRRRAALAVDLGGIAKGFAIDRAVAALAAAGCIQGQVNAGGDLRVFGPRVSTISVRAPGAMDATVAVMNRALAVSAPRSADSPSEHRGFYSGVTRESVPGRPVAVTAPTAAVADALTKCAIVCPPLLLERLLRELDAQLLELPLVAPTAIPARGGL